MSGSAARALLALVRRLPQALLSRTFGRIAHTPIPHRLRAPVIGAFARVVRADPAEAEHPLDGYESVGAFFTRRLRRGARTWPEQSDLVCSPVDGIVGAHGVALGDDLVQAKGHTYSVAQLLGDRDAAVPFLGGVYLTLYLSPRHYHRIHCPIDARVTRAIHLPGGLLPVHPQAVESIDQLFVHNERIVVLLDGSHMGRLALVAIGAYNVGAISTAFDTDWGVGGPVSNRRRAATPVRDYSPPLVIDRGAELMSFHMGSTVVLLCEPDRVRLTSEVREGGEVHVGEVIMRPVRPVQPHR